MITLFVLVLILFTVLIRAGKNENKDKIVTSILPKEAICDIKNGKIPLFKYPFVLYEYDEKCHLVDNAKCFTYSNSKYYQRISVGRSVKRKRSRYRVNFANTYPVVTTQTHKYEGTLIITNHRIIFNSDEYSVSIPLSCVVVLTPYNNRIIINSGKSIDCFYVADGYVVYNLLNNIFQTKETIMLTKTVSENLKDYYLSNNKEVIVTTLRGNQHKIRLSDDNKYLYSITALGNENNVLFLDWFDGIVEFLRQNGGKAKKGGSRNSKVGYGKCVQGTLCYYVATQCYNKSLGESTLDSIFAICAILENAGICKNKYGYIQLTGEYL